MSVSDVNASRYGYWLAGKVLEEGHECFQLFMHDYSTSVLYHISVSARIPFHTSLRRMAYVILLMTPALLGPHCTINSEEP